MILAQSGNERIEICAGDKGLEGLVLQFPKGGSSSPRPDYARITHLSPTRPIITP